MHRTALLISFALTTGASLGLSAEPDLTTFADAVRPFLSKHCTGCHGPDTAPLEALLV